MKAQYLSIPEPCHEDWDKMSPTEKGAFCASCQKEVIDLSRFDQKTAKTAVHELINQQQSPCIRIEQTTLNEINFLEWFDHLSLRKKLKYAFLFAFLLVFKFNVTAQENPINPQQIQIESNDLAESKCLAEENLLDTAEVSPPLCISWDPGEGILSPWELPFSGGAISITEIPYITIEGVYGATLSSAYIDVLPSVFDKNVNNVPFLNEIIVNSHLFSFSIENDTLDFSIKARFEDDIVIHVIKDQVADVLYPEKNTLLFLPLHISKGEQHFPISLKKLQNGSYTIRIVSSGKMGVSRIMYW